MMENQTLNARLDAALGVQWYKTMFTILSHTITVCERVAPGEEPPWVYDEDLPEHAWEAITADQAALHDAPSLPDYCGDPAVAAPLIDQYGIDQSPLFNPDGSVGRWEARIFPWHSKGGVGEPWIAEGEDRLVAVVSVLITFLEDGGE